LDHVVAQQEETISRQEEMIRRQQENIRALLQTGPALTAPATITRFFRRIRDRSKGRALLASLRSKRNASTLASTKIASWWRRVLKQRHFEAVRNKAVVLQSLVRGHRARRPARFRDMFSELAALTSELARRGPEEEEIVCPITREVVTDPLVCLVDEHT
jgi:chorismate mutase